MYIVRYVCISSWHYKHTLTYLTGFHLGGGGGGAKGGNCPPLDILCPPLGFKMLNDLPVYGQLVTLTIRKFLAAPP